MPGRLAWLLVLMTGALCARCSWDWDNYADHNAGNATTCATGVSDVRVARLSRGIDLYGWLENPSSFANFITDADLQRLAKAGVTFVRASFYSTALFDEAQPDVLNATNLAYFREAADRARAAGLGIVFVPYFDPAFKQQLEDPDPTIKANALDKLFRMWSKFASFINDFDADWVFPELFGAPDFSDSGSWNQILQSLTRTVRGAAPGHSLIVDGNSGKFRVDWNSIGALKNLQAIQGEHNVIYGFIYFDPVIFTHQGATWRPEWPELQYAQGVPYPSSPELVVPALSAISNIVAYAEVAIYGDQSWGAERLSIDIDQVAKWSADNCARVMCVEFGTYRKYAPPDSAARWVKDVRTLLEHNRIAWSYWSYDSEQFALLPEQPGPVIEPAIAQSLGLAP